MLHRKLPSVLPRPPAPVEYFPFLAPLFLKGNEWLHGRWACWDQAEQWLLRASLSPDLHNSASQARQQPLCGHPLIHLDKLCDLARPDGSRFITWRGQQQLATMPLAKAARVATCNGCHLPSGGHQAPHHQAVPLGLAAGAGNCLGCDSSGHCSPGTTHPGGRHSTASITWESLI